MLNILDQRTVEILAQVTYKEICEDERNGKEHKDFWGFHEEETLNLARNILKVWNKINAKPTTNEIINSNPTIMKKNKPQGMAILSKFD